MGEAKQPRPGVHQLSARWTIFTGSVGSYGLGLAAGGQLFLSHIGIQSYSFNRSINDTNWHHVALTLDPCSDSIWTGGPAAELQVPISFTSSGTFAIGSLPAAFNGYFYAFLGAIDEFSFYSEELSAESVQAIYTAGAAGKMHGLHSTCSWMYDPGWCCGPVSPGHRRTGSGLQPAPGSKFLSDPFARHGQRRRDLQTDAGIAVPSSTLQSQDFTVETWLRRDSLTTASSTSPGDAAIFAGGDHSFSSLHARDRWDDFVSYVGVVRVPVLPSDSGLILASSCGHQVWENVQFLSG